jgi:hypothetical protein
MATFSTFDTFLIDDERQFLGSVYGGSGGNAEFEGPISATFTSPPMERGDSFDLLTALSNESGVEIYLYSGGLSQLVEDDLVRGVIMDLYWRDNSLGELRNVSAYPGIPVRFKLGSYTETVNGIVTNFAFINYRAQSIGRRVVLLDQDPSRPIWSLSNLQSSAINEERLWNSPICNIITLELAPEATYDENEGADPPLPPNIVPLTATLYGRAYFFFYAEYSYGWTASDGTPRAGTTLAYTRPYYRYVPYGVGWYGGSGTASV